MPLSVETIVKAKEWRLSAAFVDLNDPRYAEVALLNIGKGPLGVIIERGITVSDAAPEITDIMRTIIREAISDDVLISYRKRLRRWLETLSEAEMEAWILDGVLPWEQPMWTEELESLGQQRGLSFPWN